MRSILIGEKQKKVVIVTGIVAVVMFFMGCAGSLKRLESEAVLPEIDVIQVKENSDEALRLAQEAKLDVEVLSARVTELDNRMILLSEQVANVSVAKIEELETRLVLLTEAYKDLHTQLRALENSALRAASKPAAKPSVPTFSPASAADLLTSSPEYDLYQSGLRIYNGRNYNQAVKVFSELLQKFPEGTYRDNAQFWIGESQYQTGDYTAAIAAFQKVFAFPNSPKADDAQFKIGLAYHKSGNTEQFITELRKLIERYPSSEYVERARKYISDLK